MQRIMNYRLVSGSLPRLFLLLLFGLLSSVSSEPAQCITWRKVYPHCPCIPAMDTDGNELDSVAVVDCSSKNPKLEAVPMPIKRFYTGLTLYEFRLNDNNITSLPNNAFQGIKIRNIDLTGNIIGNVGDNAFEGTETDLLILSIEGDKGYPPRSSLIKLLQLKKLTMKNYNVPHLNDSGDHLLFNSFSYLNDLTMDDWGLESIDAHAFISAGNSNPLRRLTLINQKLVGLPVDVLAERELSNLEMLQISGTEIQEIFGYAFSNLKEIIEINLSENLIKTIAEDSFINVGKLEKIDLSKNVLGAKTTKISLPGLANLKNLILSTNELVSIPKMERLGSGEPLNVDLSNNMITQLSENDLGSYGQRLLGLDLSGNAISVIHPQVFSGVTNLESFIMPLATPSTTSLSVPTSLIQSAASLTHLDISGHNLEENTLWSVVRTLNNLEELILHNTQLASIPDLAFQNLVNLRNLDLSFNSITAITDKTFVGPRHLKKLTLRSMGIGTIPACLFYQQIANLSLDLGSNIIECDCSVKPLLKNYLDGFISFQDNSNSIPTCQDGKLLISQKLETFNNCPSRQCEDYYVTTPPPEPQTTHDGQPPVMTIQILVKEKMTKSLTIGWNTNGDSSELEYISVIVTSIDKTEFEEEFRNGESSTEITGLKPKTSYNVCVNGFFQKRQPISNCTHVRTEEEASTSPTGDADTTDIGIIVGCVVGALALLAIVAAIIYLIFIRRRPKKLAAPPSMAGPVQPRSFAKSELPSMNGDTRSFVKVKKNGAAGASAKPVGGGMKVVAISDGQTTPSSGGRVGRAHQYLSSDGTYEPMNKLKPVKDDTDYEPMKTQFDPKQGAVNSAYENDHGSLPPTPTSPSQLQFDSPPPPSYHYYTNEAFTNDKYEEVVL